MFGFCPVCLVCFLQQWPTYCSPPCLSCVIYRVWFSRLSTPLLHVYLYCSLSPVCLVCAVCLVCFLRWSTYCSPACLPTALSLSCMSCLCVQSIGCGSHGCLLPSMHVYLLPSCTSCLCVCVWSVGSGSYGCLLLSCMSARAGFFFRRLSTPPLHQCLCGLFLFFVCQSLGIAEGRGGARGPENVWGSAATGE